jgi:hypothetical protein
MNLRNFFSNGEGPAAKGAVPIRRECPVIIGHGGYAEKCTKTVGHEGLHMGRLVIGEEYEQARRTTPFVTQDHAPGSIMLVQDPADMAALPRSTPGSIVPVVQADQLPADLPPAVRVFLAPVLTQLTSMNDRFARFETNVHQFNLVAGELVNKTLVPLKAELEQLRYNLGDKANSTVSMLERLVTHVDRQLDIALKLTGASAGDAVAYRTENGCHGDVPSITELTETGVKAAPDGTALQATAENLLAQLEQVRAQNIRLTRENAQLKAAGYGE